MQVFGNVPEDPDVKSALMDHIAAQQAAASRTEDAYKRILAIFQAALNEHEKLGPVAMKEQPSPVDIMEYEMLASAEVLLSFYSSLSKHAMRDKGTEGAFNIGIIIGKLNAVRTLLKELVDPPNTIIIQPQSATD